MHLACYATAVESARCERPGKVSSKASSGYRMPQVASTVVEADVCDAYSADLRDMLDAGLGVDGCARKAVEVGDRGILCALKRHVRLIYKALEQKDQLRLIASIKPWLFNDAEQAASLELQETIGNVGLLRGSPVSNHEVLDSYFQKAANMQAFVFGQLSPPSSIFAWTPFVIRDIPSPFFAYSHPAAGELQVGLLLFYDCLDNRIAQPAQPAQPQQNTDSACDKRGEDDKQHYGSLQWCRQTRRDSPRTWLRWHLINFAIWCKCNVVISAQSDMPVSMAFDKSPIAGEYAF